MYLALAVPGAESISGTGNDVVDTVLKMMQTMMGDGIKSIGFQLSSSKKKMDIDVTGSTLAAEFPVSLNPWDIAGGRGRCAG